MLAAALHCLKHTQVLLISNIDYMLYMLVACHIETEVRVSSSLGYIRVPSSPEDMPREEPKSTESSRRLFRPRGESLSCPQKRAEMSACAFSHACGARRLTCSILCCRRDTHIWSSILVSCSIEHQNAGRCALEPSEVPVSCPVPSCSICLFCLPWRYILVLSFCLVPSHPALLLHS